MGTHWGVPPLECDSFCVVHLGHYSVGLREDVQSFWAFDEKGKLLDVCIRRSVDGP